jgi:radical SAM superfamily enzyme YgiQ (UPF0313 family)
MKSRKIILIQPKSGKYDAFVKDLPLGVLCAGRSARDAGYDVEIIDQRVEPEWEKRLLSVLQKEQPLLVGLSVMTGKPIQYALEISRLVKNKSNTPVLWGGIHPTILSDSTLKNEFIDFLIRGQGELPLLALAEALENDPVPLHEVPALSYKANGQIIHNPVGKVPEFDELPDIPYSLVDVHKYIRFEADEKVFSVITSIGCPHQCAFCYSSSYSGRLWKPEKVDRTIARLEEIIQKYKPDYLSVIDNDFFVDLRRAKTLFEALEKKKWPVRIGFRGARVDELYRMDDDLLALMQRVGVRHLHIGAESGSQQILNLMLKKVTTAQIFEVNRKLSKFPGLLPTYNFFSGIPTENIEDIQASIEMIFRLLKENPHCQISGFNQFTPYPGTELFTLSMQHGLKPPENLEGWIDFDESDCAKNNPWIDSQRKRLLDTLYFTGFFIDNKFQMHFTGDSLRNCMFRYLAAAYRPIAKLRFKHGFTAIPVELALKRLIDKIVERG